MIGSFREHGIIGAYEDDPKDDIGDGGDDLVLENGQQPFCVVPAESAVDDVRSSKVGVLQTRAESRRLRVIAALYETIRAALVTRAARFRTCLQGE